MNQNCFYVYVLYRAGGIPFYVGKGSGNRCQDHLKKSHNPIVNRIISKEKEFIRVTRHAENLTESSAFAIEKELILSIGRIDRGGTLVNLTDGGEGVVGHKRTKEQREAMSLARKGNVFLSPESCKKISDAHKGKPKSPEHCAAVSAAKKGVKAGPMPQSQRDKIGDAHRGRKRTGKALEAIRAGQKNMTEEQKALRIAKVSFALTGKKLSAEHRAKISKIQKGIIRSEEFKKKVSAGMKEFYKKNKRKSIPMPETTREALRLYREKKKLAKSMSVPDECVTIAGRELMAKS